MKTENFLSLPQFYYGRQTDLTASTNCRKVNYMNNTRAVPLVGNDLITSLWHQSIIEEDQ